MVGFHPKDRFRVVPRALRPSRVGELVPSAGGAGTAARGMPPPPQGLSASGWIRARPAVEPLARWLPPSWNVPVPLRDLLLAVGVGLVMAAGLFGRRAGLPVDDPSAPLTAPDALAVLLVLVAAVPIVGRTRYPWPAAALTCAGSLLLWGRGYEPQPIPYGPLVVVFTLAERKSARSSLIATSALLSAIFGEYFSGPGALSDDLVIAYVLSIGASWTLGYGIQANRERAALLEAQAALLARQQTFVADLAVERERARIARDLHDIVSHHVSVIVAQATAAQRLPPGDPVGAARTLRSIESSGREAMVQMRRMLGVLQPPSAGADRAGGDGLERLPELLATMGRSGLLVTLVVEGSARPLPRDVDGSAYIIVREALTNVLKHAGSAEAQVALAYRDDAVRIQVRDDGNGGSGRSGAGHGLVGALQRATLLGGSFAAGRLPGGGFEVVTELPVTRWPDVTGRRSA
jgi:signal transduction histidine kinase